MGGAVAAIPTIMAAIGGGAAAAGSGAAAGASALPSLMSAPAGAEGIASAMPAGKDLFGALGQALPKAETIMDGGPKFGMGDNGGPGGTEKGGMENTPAMKGLFGGAPGTDGGLNPDDYAPKNPVEPQNPDDFPGQGALAHYKDMSQYGNMNAISGLMNSQPGQKQNRVRREKPQIDQYLQSLMGG